MESRGNRGVGGGPKSSDPSSRPQRGKRINVFKISRLPEGWGMGSPEGLFFLLILSK